MSTAASEFSLPLLARELTELAARRRTYVVRVLYAVALLFSGWLAFRVSTMDRSALSLNYLGSGAVLLWWTGYLQNIGLLIVLPALTCDVFTREKERQTIGLLLITRLTSWTIVLEKFFSRLLPAVCLLLISLPLLAFSYSLGGVEAWQVVNTACGLMTNAIVLTALAVACSAFCHSTTSAFMWTYAVLLVTPLKVVSTAGGADHFDFIINRYFGRALYLNVPRFGANFAGLLPSATDSPLMMCVRNLVYCLPSLAFAAFFLLLAKWVLVSRAAKVPQSDTAWNRQIQRFRLTSVAGNPDGRGSLVSDPSRWPDESPVAWRELHKRWMSHPRLHVLILTGLLLLVCFSAWRTVWSGYVPGPQKGFINVAGIGLWLTMLFTLIVATANLITQEKGQQTLLVLLTTPITGSEILRQKMAGIRRLVWTFVIPLGVCLVIRMLIATPQVQRREAGNVPYPLAFINEVSMLWIYPQLVMWLALYYSLKSKTTIAAIMKTVLTIALQCVLPWLLLILVAITAGGLQESTFFLIMLVLMIGPADLLLYGYDTDCIPPGFDQSVIPLIVNSMIHGGIWWRLRRKCLTEADRLLGRGGQ